MQLDALYTHIRSVPLADYTSHSVILLRGFAISALQSAVNAPLKAKRWYGLEEFWQLMQATSPAPPDLQQMAANMLSDLLGWQHCYPQRPPYLERCVQQLRSGQSVPQALRLCQRICTSFPAKPRKVRPATVPEPCAEPRALLFCSDAPRLRAKGRGFRTEYMAPPGEKNVAV